MREFVDDAAETLELRGCLAGGPFEEWVSLVAAAASTLAVVVVVMLRDGVWVRAFAVTVTISLR